MVARILLIALSGSMLVIALGAVLVWLAAIDLHTVGLILLVVGAFSAVVAIDALAD